MTDVQPVEEHKQRPAVKAVKPAKYEAVIYPSRGLKNLATKKFQYTFHCPVFDASTSADDFTFSDIPDRLAFGRLRAFPEGVLKDAVLFFSLSYVKQAFVYVLYVQDGSKPAVTETSEAGLSVLTQSPFHLLRADVMVSMNHSFRHSFFDVPLGDMVKRVAFDVPAHKLRQVMRQGQLHVSVVVNARSYV